MPQTTDSHEIRSILRRDPVWGVYALGDLAPPMFEHTQWFTPDLSLVLRLHDTTILFAMGTRSIREALDHVTWPVHLQVQDDALNEVARHATVTDVRAMLRMAWRGADLPAVAVTALAERDVPALRELFADGVSTGEAPDFFHPSMVSAGAFFGIYEDGRLSAAAGTHLLAREEHAAAVGNVYTRRDCRGRGLGRAVTAAVVRALDGIETIGLNVRADNAAAIRVYESLGFVRHCPFFEGLAVAKTG